MVGCSACLLKAGRFPSLQPSAGSCLASTESKRQSPLSTTRRLLISQSGSLTPTCRFTARHRFSGSQPCQLKSSLGRNQFSQVRCQALSLPQGVKEAVISMGSILPELWMQWAVVAGCIVVLSLKVLQFLTADADLALLNKGAVKQGSLNDKVVWITGASQGIGEALARKFSACGARVILSARRQEKLQQVKDSVCAEGGIDASRLHVLPLDIAGDRAAVAAAVEAAEAAFGGAGVDILVHNAAAPRPKGPALEGDTEEEQRMFAVNFFGPVAVTRALVPKMLERRRGSIVVVSSAAGRLASPAQAMYAATKHAAHGYFDSLRYEVCDKGINVVMVCPGPIASSSDDPAHKEKGRMSVERCAELILRAAAHRVREAWISTHPILALLYVRNLLPSLCDLVMCKVGPKRVSAFKSGGANMYSVNLLWKKKE